MDHVASQTDSIEFTSRSRLLVSISGILGCLMLIVYFSAPFLLFPFPSSNASPTQIVANVSQYQFYYQMAAWLQVTGTFLIVVFVLGLVFVSKSWNRFSGWITMLASAVILMLSVTEGTFFLDAAQAVSNGHLDAAVTSFDLTFVFLHSFFIAPSLLVPIAFVLRGSNILPKLFWVWALVVGIAFETMGFLGLFLVTSLPSILLIVLMTAWVICGSVTLAFK